MDMNRLAQAIVQMVGGKDNIMEVTHCFTRLRFCLRDVGDADTKNLEQLEGVLKVVIAGGQYQVVLGSKVKKVFLPFYPLLVRKLPKGKLPKQGGFSSLFLVLAQILPLWYLPSAAWGWWKGLLLARRFSYLTGGLACSAHVTTVL